MKGTPLVSVIIPFYNEKEWLIQAVESALTQTYSNIEIIVINDGSLESMEDFLNTYGEKINYIYINNSGPAVARNKGIEVAKGEYIAFLDSDDIWNEIKIEKQVRFMISSGYKWSHTEYETFGEGENRIIKFPTHKGKIYPDILISTPIATPCIMIETSILKNNPELRFNNNMRYGQDYFLWIKLSENYSIGLIESPLTKVRMRGTNAAKRALVQIKVRGAIYGNFSSFGLKSTKYSVKLAYKYCYRISIWLNNIEKKITQDSWVEFLSKVLYLFPYLIFRMEKLKITKRFKEV